MSVAGTRRILAPRHRIHLALTDPGFVLNHLPGTFDGVADLKMSDLGDNVVWQSEGSETRFHLMPEQEDSTLLTYYAETESDDETDICNRIEAFIDSLQSELAGPREVAADSPLIIAANSAQPKLPFRAWPKMIFGMPLIFWAGSAVFFLIFVSMFSAYL